MAQLTCSNTPATHQYQMNRRSTQMHVDIFHPTWNWENQIPNPAIYPVPAPNQWQVIWKSRVTCHLRNWDLSQQWHHDMTPPINRLWTCPVCWTPAAGGTRRSLFLPQLLPKQCLQWANEKMVITKIQKDKNKDEYPSLQKVWSFSNWTWIKYLYYQQLFKLLFCYWLQLFSL